MATELTSQMRHLTIMTVAVGAMAFLILIVSVFSSPWIVGHFPTNSNVTHNGTVTELNTTSSCTEGPVTICCHKLLNVSTYSPETSRFIHIGCYVRSHSDFTGENLSVFQASQALTIIALLCCIPGVALSIIFLVWKKVNQRLVIFQMVLLFSTYFCLTVALIVMSCGYHKFTGMIGVTTGWCLTVGAVADAVVSVTALLASLMYQNLRQTQTSYEII